ncbi:RNA polymerase sigma factor, partial [candidate division KSB1 bacterium]
GDSNAFNLLVERWQTPIYQLAYRFLGNEEDAKDICQNTFIKAYKNIRKIKDIESFPMWIRRIAVNLCKDEFSRRKRERYASQINLGNESSFNVSDNNKADFEEEIMKKDVGEIIKKAVGTLREEQKIILILKEYQGLKFTEIAEVLNISVNTAKSRMYYALKNVKNILERHRLDKEVYKK